MEFTRTILTRRVRCEWNYGDHGADAAGQAARLSLTVTTLDFSPSARNYTAALPSRAPLGRLQEGSRITHSHLASHAAHSLRRHHRRPRRRVTARAGREARLAR